MPPFRPLSFDLIPAAASAAVGCSEWLRRRVRSDTSSRKCCIRLQQIDSSSERRRQSLFTKFLLIYEMIKPILCDV
ncbi:hypothetical protein C4D60_Mb09t14580 [Musa balbisiana]|uniref:Uncharacterized protein n=1 Tax=Musa balbisiana TaxID=52838 RepID=A0A4S8IGI4_MUSBA|nr:hypothetical protein C4D60_Mb09t14580 [Musa balbisiana]